MESVPTAVPTAAFSAIELAERRMFVGASLMFVTLIVNDLSVVKPPASVERTRIVYELFVS